jgi:hypothetical protein
MKKQFRHRGTLHFKFIVAFICLLGFNHAQSQKYRSQPCNGVAIKLMCSPCVIAGTGPVIAPIIAVNIPGGQTVTT